LSPTDAYRTLFKKSRHNLKHNAFLLNWQNNCVDYGFHNQRGVALEYTAGIFGISFLICVAGVLFFLNAEKNSFKQILEKAETMQTELVKTNKEIQATNLRIDEMRTIIFRHKNEVDCVQDHCAKIREQQQILSRRQKTLHDKMIPSRIELSIVETKPAPKTDPKLIKKIQKQMKDLQ